MSDTIKKLAMLGVAAAGATTLAVGGSSAAADTPVPAAPATSHTAKPADNPCGYYGYQRYNHCGATTVMLTVEHFFGSDDHYCASPGDNYINAGNDPNNSWVTTYAYYAGGPINCSPGWYR